MADDNNQLVNEAEKQEKNIGHRWQAGESGNPKGRPHKGHSITETIRSMMDEKPEIKKALGAKILQHAMEGDTVAMKLIWNYLDGMPKQTTELSGPDGGPIPILGSYVHPNISDPKAPELKEEN